MEFKFDNLPNKLLIIAFLFFSAIFVINFTSAVGDGKFYPCDQDEAIIFSSAKLFYETGSVKAASMISEDSSKILGTSWYGPFYHLLYGGLAKVFGFHKGLIIIYTNFILLALSLLLFYFCFPEKNNRLFGIFLLLISPVLMPYFFTFFPQVLSIFFSVILLYLIINVNNKYELNQNYKKEIYLFLGFVLFFSLFKVTYVFWAVGILPFFRTRKEFFKNAILFFFTFLIVYLYMSYFIAPPYASQMKVLSLLKKFKIIALLGAFFSQISYNLSYYFLNTLRDITSLITFILAMIMFLSSFKEKNRFIFSGALIIALYYLVLLAFYNPHYYYLTKQTMPIYPLILYLYVNYFKERYALVILVIFISFIPQNINTTLSNIKQRRIGYLNYEENYKSLREAFNELKKWVHQDKESIILWDYDEHGYPGSNTGVIIPNSNNAGKAIRYTTNIYWTKVPDSLQFEFHKKLPVDFVLSKDSLSLKNLQLIHKNNFYHFYKRIK